MSRLIDDNELVEVIGELKQAEYNRGLQDAWELAKKLWVPERQGGIHHIKVRLIFGCDMYDIPNKFTVQEALAKIEAYEKEQEQIKVGDVVEVMGHYCVITSIDKDDKEYDVLWSSGVAGSVPFDAPFSFIKTGKHINITEILAEIGKE